MRSKTEMLNLILQTAKENQVEAIAMNGSRANQNVKKDNFQDYDIVYFVEIDQMKELLKHRQWLEKFGQTIVMQVPGDFAPEPKDGYDFFTFLMLFKDGNRIDLGLCPLNKIAQWQANNPISQILYDPKHLLPDNLVSTDEIYYQNKPTQKEFLETCNEFWWVSTYVVKGIKRKEMLYATDHLYQNCFQEFLKIISFEVAQKYDYRINLGKNHKYLFDCLTENEIGQIKQILNLGDYQQITESLLLMQELFNNYAQQFAEASGYDYDDTESLNVMEYTKKQLK